MPGSSYKKLNRFLFPFLQMLPGAFFETNSKYARAALDVTKLEEDVAIVSHYVKSLYINVLIEEVIEIAL